MAYNRMRPTTWTFPSPDFSMNGSSSPIKRKKHPLWVDGVIGVVSCVVLLFTFLRFHLHINELRILREPYDQRPLSIPIPSIKGYKEYKIAVVTDLDHFSKDGENQWKSFMKTATLKIFDDSRAAKIEWIAQKDSVLKSSMSSGGRGMELSDLVVYDRKLYTIDDRTGLVYQVDGAQVIPHVILVDGPGNVTKPLKGEWMTVKDRKMIVGGLGKEWTTGDGVFVNDHPMWIKEIDHLGHVQHTNWSSVYRKLRDDLGIPAPGYIIHEAVQWSEFHRKWFFLPRRLSHQKYDEEADEKRGTNVLISIDELFSEKCEVVHVGSPMPHGSYKGFSAFQFVPDTEDTLIVALKSEEKNGQPVGSHISLFNVWGTEILDDVKVPGNYKFEGIAFV